MAFRKSYGTRKMGTGRRTYRRKTASPYKKVVRPTRQALPALARQVRQLKQAVVPLTQNKLFYKYGGNVNIGSPLGTQPYILNLSQASGWTRIWGTDADDESSHVFMQKPGLMKWQAVINGETALVNYTLALVSLTKIGATELFNSATGGLNTITDNVHFTQPAAGFLGAGTLLNKRYFNIHYYRNTKTYSTSGYVGEGKPNIMGTVKIPGAKWINPNGDWRAKGYNPNAMQNYYLIIFNNDSTADADIAFQYNALIQGTAV